MPELDFHGLRDEAGDAAKQPEFASVARRAGRIRARGTAATAAAVAALAVATVAGSTLAASTAALPPATGSPSADPSSTDPSSTDPSSDPSGAALRPPVAQWAAAGDATHLYAVSSDCPLCPSRLMGSDDGGRTWRQRHVFRESFPSFHVRVHGPKVLVQVSGQHGVSASGGKLTRAVGTYRVSGDGGVTWRDLAWSQSPVAAAPAGSAPAVTACDLLPQQQDCPLSVVDAAAGRLARLANQPPLTEMQSTGISAGAGLWVTGHDPASKRPAVSVSRDGGRSWNTKVFTDEPAAQAETDLGTGSSPGVNPADRTQWQPKVTTIDGRTAYALFRRGADSSAQVYRTTDGGRVWQRVEAAGVPTEPNGVTWTKNTGWVTADGGHVLFSASLDRYLSSADGRRYTPLALTGLDEETAMGVRTYEVTMAGAGYLLQGVRGLYLSTDGRNWRRVLS